MSMYITERAAMVSLVSGTSFTDFGTLSGFPKTCSFSPLLSFERL
jgi:hypothetical protein